MRYRTSDDKVIKKLSTVPPAFIPLRDELLALIYDQIEQGIDEPRKWLLWYDLYISGILPKYQPHKMLARFGSHNSLPMTAAYCLTYLFSATAALVLVVLGNVPHIVPFLQTLMSAESKNYDDSQGFLALVGQLRYREFLPALINGFCSSQLILITLMSQHSVFLSLAATTVSGAFGFSFALFMFAPFMIECIKINKCNKNINRMEIAINSCEDENRREGLRKALNLEKAIKADYVRSRNSWLICTVAMTAITLIAFFAMSGATFGALPAAVLIITAFGIGIGIARNYYVSRVNHIENLKNENFIIHHQLQERCNNLPLLGVSDEKMAFIRHLIHSAPQKALAVISIYENQNGENLIKDILSQHRNRFFSGGFGKTASLKAWLSLQEHSISPPKAVRKADFNLVNSQSFFRLLDAASRLLPFSSKEDVICSKL